MENKNTKNNSNIKFFFFLSLLFTFSIISSPLLVSSNPLSDNILEYFDFGNSGTTTEQSLTTNNIITYGTGVGKTTSSIIGSHALYLNNNEISNFSENPLPINFRDEPFSISFIAQRQGNVGGTVTLFQLRNQENTAQFLRINSIGTFTSNQQRINFRLQSTSLDAITLESSTITGINHYVITSNVTHIKMYENSNLILTLNNTLTLNPDFNNSTQIIGSASNTQDRRLHQFITYNTYLTQSDVDILYNNGFGVQTENFNFAPPQQIEVETNHFPASITIKNNALTNFFISDYFTGFDPNSLRIRFIDVYTNQSNIIELQPFDIDGQNYSYTSSRFNITFVSKEDGLIQINTNNQTGSIPFGIELYFPSLDELRFYGNRFFEITSGDITDLSPLLNQQTNLINIPPNTPFNFNVIGQNIPNPLFKPSIPPTNRIPLFNLNPNNYKIEITKPNGEVIFIFRNQNVYEDDQIIINPLSNEVVFTSKNPSAETYNLRFTAFNNYGSTTSNPISLRFTSTTGVIIPEGEIIESPVNSLVDIFLNLFPLSESLNSRQRYGYVIVTMLLIGFGIIFSLKDERKGINPATPYVLGVGLSLMFIYFVSIGYISIGVIISMLLVLIAITYFKFRGGATA